MREMNHRVKNLFAVVSSVVRLSSRSAVSAKDLARIVDARLTTLARAHDLIMPKIGGSRVAVQRALLSELATVS